MHATEGSGRQGRNQALTVHKSAEFALTGPLLIQLIVDEV